MYKNEERKKLENGTKIETEKYIYTITDFIGFGGTSLIYMAERLDKELKSNRKIAIKEFYYLSKNLYRDEFGEILMVDDISEEDKSINDKYKEAFLREYRISNEIDCYCNSFIKIEDYKQGVKIILNDGRSKDIGNLFLFMTPLSKKGITLSDIIATYNKKMNRKRFLLIDAIEIVKRILISLKEIHINENTELDRLLHGDIKEENLFFTTNNIEFKNNKIDSNTLGNALFIDLSTIRPVNVDIDGILYTEEIDREDIFFSYNCAPEYECQDDLYIANSYSSMFDIEEDDFLFESNKKMQLSRGVDIYSVGIILFKLIWGIDYNKDEHSRNYKIKHSDKDKIGCNKNQCVDMLNNILSKSLAYSVFERYKNAGEFLNDLIELENKLLEQQKKIFSKAIIKNKTLKRINSVGIDFSDKYIYINNGLDNEKEIFFKFQDKHILLWGDVGIGKSTILKKYINFISSKGKVPIYINLVHANKCEQKSYLTTLNDFGYIISLIYDQYYFSGEDEQDNDLIRKIYNEMKNLDREKEYVVVLEDIHKVDKNIIKKVVSDINILSDTSYYKNIQIIVSSTTRDYEGLNLYKIEVPKINKHEILGNLNRADVDLDFMNKQKAILMLDRPMLFNMFVEPYNCLNEADRNISSITKIIKNYLDYCIKNYFEDIGCSEIVVNDIYYEKEVIIFLIEYLISKAAYFSYYDYSISREVLKEVLEESLPLVYNDSSEFFDEKFSGCREKLVKLNRQYTDEYNGCSDEYINEVRLNDILEIFVERIKLLYQDTEKSYVFFNDIYFEYFRDRYLLDKYIYIYEKEDIMPLMKYTCLNLPQIKMKFIASSLYLYNQLEDIYNDDIVYMPIKLEASIKKFIGLNNSYKNMFLEEIKASRLYLKKFNFRIYSYLSFNLFINYMEYIDKVFISRISKNKNLINKILRDNSDMEKYSHLDAPIIYQLYLSLLQGIKLSKIDGSWVKLNEARLCLFNNVHIDVFNEKEMYYIRLLNYQGLRGINLYDIGFDPQQLNEIEMGLYRGLEVENYLDIGFEHEQMREIRLGLEQNIDVGAYADYRYNSRQMEEIRFGKIAGLNVDKYAFTHFNGEQMREIRLGLEFGLKKISYLDPRFSWEQMAEIRKGLQNNVDIIDYVDFDFEPRQMMIIRDAVEAGIEENNIRLCADKSFEFEQMQELFLGLKNGVDVSKYKDLKFDYEQMKEIRLGLEDGLNVDKYLNNDFDYEQMREIRLGLKDGLDVDKYLNKNFNNEQMKEIRLGLNYKINVIYADYNYDENQMKEIREGLLEKLEVEKYYLDYRFKSEQMEQIKLGLQDRLDVSYYAKLDFSWRQMEQVRLGLQLGLDVSKYTKSELNWRQMEQVKIGLEKNLNVDVYLKSQFSWKQMEEIRNAIESGNIEDIDLLHRGFSLEQIKEISLGRLAGVDTSIYERSDFDSSKMKLMRICLINNNKIKENIFSSSDEKYEDMVNSLLDVMRQNYIDILNEFSKDDILIDKFKGDLKYFLDSNIDNNDIVLKIIDRKEKELLDNIEFLDDVDLYDYDFESNQVFLPVIENRSNEDTLFDDDFFDGWE